MFETLTVTEDYFFRRRFLRVGSMVGGNLVAAVVHLERASMESPLTVGCSGSVPLMFERLASDWVRLAPFELALRGELEAAKAWLAGERNPNNTWLRRQTEKRLNEAKIDLVRCWIFNGFNTETGFLEGPILSPAHFHGSLMEERWEPLGLARSVSIQGSFTVEGRTWTYRRQCGS